MYYQNNNLSVNTEVCTACEISCVIRNAGIANTFVTSAITVG